MGDQGERHDPFSAPDDSEMTSLVSQFKPKPKSAPVAETEKSISALAVSRGFVDRTPKEPTAPLRPLQFRLTTAEVEEFNDQALKEYGNEHGGKIKLFRKMMRHYMETME